MKINFNNIDFETTEVLEKISVYDQIYECIGYDLKGFKYKAIAIVSCNEIIEITDIELLNESKEDIRDMFFNSINKTIETLNSPVNENWCNCENKYKNQDCPKHNF